MSKKLVKTAKQQFEERLRELGLWKEWEEQSCEGLVGKVLGDKDIVIYRYRKDEGTFSEMFFPSFKELRKDSRFFHECLEVFVSDNSQDFVVKLVEWLVYGEKECPLHPVDVYFPAEHLQKESSHDFYDVYEEVPDVRIITAKEQWEKDSQGAEVIQKLANGSIYKVAVTDASITFFVHRGGGEYFREVYPSFDELRKDAGFVTEYLSHVRDTHDTDMDAALTWLQGGEYTMSKVSLLDIYEVGEDIDHLCYHDEEERVEDIRKDFSQDVDELRKKMVTHLQELCERGMTVNMDCLTKHIALAWDDESFIYTEDIKGLFIEKNEKGEWIFYYSSRFYDKSREYPFEYTPIETLQKFIASMQ